MVLRRVSNIDSLNVTALQNRLKVGFGRRQIEISGKSICAFLVTGNDGFHLNASSRKRRHHRRRHRAGPDNRKIDIGHRVFLAKSWPMAWGLSVDKRSACVVCHWHSESRVSLHSSARQNRLTTDTHEILSARQTSRPARVQNSSPPHPNA